MRQFDVSLCRVCQVCRSVAVSIHVRCGIADNLFFLAVGHGNVGAIDGILYSLFYRSGIQNFLTLFAITVNRKVLKGIIPSIGSLIATQNMLISSAFHLLTISVKLKDYSCRTDVIIILGVSPLHSYRNRLSIAIMRYLDIEFACGPSVTISSLCNVSIKVRGNLCLIDNFLSAIVLFHISKCVSPKVEVRTAVDGCSAYIYRLPTIGLGIPLISGEFNIHRFRTSVVSIAFIIPVNRNGFVNQFNVTGDDGTILVTRRIICAIKVLGCIVVLIVLSCLVVISNRSGIGDCLTIKVLLIVSPSISPYVSVIGNSANSGVSTYNASARVVTQKVLYSLTISIQVQGYCTRTNTVVIAVVIPLDGELNIVAGCNQVMLKIDITCVQRSIVVDCVSVSSRYCIIITRCRRTFNLTGSCSGVIDGMSDPLCIVITHKDQLVSNLFGRRIRCGNRQIRECYRLLIVSIVIKSLLTYYLVGDRRYQTNRYTLRTATIIVLKIRPLNSCSICGILFVPLSVKIQNPVFAVLLSVRFVKFQTVCYFIVSARGTRPTRKRLTRCVCHVCQKMKQIIVVVGLGLNETSTLTSIIVVNLYLLSDPLCIESLVFRCLCVS